MKLTPTIIQDFKTKEVLMLGYVNDEALQKMRETGRVWFYSRSRKKLWMKGETSGNFLEIKDMKIDCDQDTILIQANPAGPTCHNGTKTCFTDMFEELYNVIIDRKLNLPEKAYTTSLFKKGLPEICSKVSEEANEVVWAAKFESKGRIISETVDLLYHLFVLTAQSDVSLEEIKGKILERRS